MNQESKRSVWVIYYVNGLQFMGRYDGRWTRSYALDGAATFDSEAEADRARQALLAEAGDRVSGKSSDRFWFDLFGGVVVTREVEIVMRLVPEARPSHEQA